jgi:protein-S-isoprenylcysteine O-methyltransferase Ste14
MRPSGGRAGCREGAVGNVIQDLFGNEALRMGLFRLRFLLGAVLLIPVGYWMSRELFWVGFAVSMLGQAIQTWCFASLIKNRELTVRGPYLLSRNPMYVGRYFMILGFVLLLNNLWIVLAYTVLYYLYMDSRIKREEKRLQRVFGESYAQYCSEVPRLLPSLRKAGEPSLWYWDWAAFRENNAHWNVLGTWLSFAFVLIVWRYFH